MTTFVLWNFIFIPFAKTNVRKKSVICLKILIYSFVFEWNIYSHFVFLLSLSLKLYSVFSRLFAYRIFFPSWKFNLLIGNSYHRLGTIGTLYTIHIHLYYNSYCIEIYSKIQVVQDRDGVWLQGILASIKPTNKSNTSNSPKWFYCLQLRKSLNYIL